MHLRSAGIALRIDLANADDLNLVRTSEGFGWTIPEIVFCAQRVL
jgi:hypothetical protein